MNKLGVRDEFTGGFIEVDSDKLVRALKNLEFIKADKATEEVLNEVTGALEPLDNPFREKVEGVLQDIKDLLLKKNDSYGNSALEPIKVFSKASAVEQLKVRIDDKISRLYHGKEYGSEDTVTDLIGYLVLLKIAEAENE